MKYALLLFIIFSSLRLFAQFNTGNAPQHNFFDPERDPIALRSDTTLQLLVSEYILCKSVKARMITVLEGGFGDYSATVVR